MKTQTTQKNKIVAKGIRPNAGISAKYQKLLDSYVTKMVKECQKNIKKWYPKYKIEVPEPKKPIAMDDNKTSKFIKEFNEMIALWVARFAKQAGKLAKEFAEKTAKYSDDMLLNHLREIGFTVKLKATTEQQDAMKAIISENVNLIKSIPVKYFDSIKSSVMTSFQMGGDAYQLQKDIEKIGYSTRKRSYLIARDQTSKALSAYSRIRSLGLGIKTGIWQHSGAGKHPRPSHVAASGKEFDLEKGCLIDGEYIQPGQLINCRCYYTPVIANID